MISSSSKCPIFFLRLRRAIFFTITYSAIWTQSRAKTTTVYLHQWYRHRVLTVIRYVWSQRRAETTLLHLHEWYMRRMLIANCYMCTFPAFPRLYRHNMLFIMQLTCTYGYTNDYLCRKIYTPHKARNMAPWTSLSLTIGYMPSKCHMIEDIQAPEGRRKKLGPNKKI